MDLAGNKLFFYDGVLDQILIPRLFTHTQNLSLIYFLSTLKTNKYIHASILSKITYIHIQNLPTINLHGSSSLQLRVHLKHSAQHVRLVAPSLLQTDPLRSFKVVHQLHLVIRMCALVDDNTCSFAGRQTANVGEALGVFFRSD